MTNFEFSMATTVVYGLGVAENLGEHCKRFNATKVFFITDKYMAEKSPITPVLLQSIKDAGLEVMVYSDVLPDPHIELVDSAAKILKEFNADLVVALGGGSPMDTAKALCLLARNEGSIAEYMHKRKVADADGIPLICLPTTAGTGSEVTTGTVITDRQSEEKIGVNHPSMRPKMAIIDPNLQMSMPPSLTAATGMDALCHAIEAYVSTKADPMSDAMNLHAIKLIGENLRTAVANGKDVEARGNMAIASLMAGIGFAQAGLGLVHGIAHCLGAMYHVPHGVANALMLPFVMEFNMIGNMKKYKNIAEALGIDVRNMTDREGAKKAVEAVFQLKKDLDIPRSLEQVGVRESDIATIVKNSITYRMLPCNPRTVTEKDIETILMKALV